MLVASEKPPVELEDATIDGLLANEVPLTSGVHGDDEDLLAAQAKVGATHIHSMYTCTHVHRNL